MTVAAPWRDPKTGIWKLKKRVPARYLAVAGQAVVKITTGEADRKNALAAWPGVLAQWAAKEASWERALNVATLDTAKAQKLALEWSRWIAAGARLDTGVRNNGRASALFDVDDITPGRIAAMWGRVEAHADEALKVADIIIDPASRPLLLQAMEPKVHGAYLQADLRRMGEVGKTRAGEPPAYASLRAKLAVALTPSPVAPKAPAATFDDILTAWKAVASVVPRVAGDVEGMMGVLKRFLGHDDAARVTTADLRRWRDATITQGLNNNTWNGRLSMVGQVFAQAVKDERLPNNPAVNAALRLPKTRPASPPPYSDAQAAQILNAARLEKRASIRWAPWIMAFTGMRVAEVMQLSVADIREDGGIHYLSINQDDPGKSVKTANRRNVPIHDALISEGLLVYAATLPPGQLFPDKKPDRYGMIGGRAYNVVGRWVRETVGITDARFAPNHSWRHRMEDELRNHEVDEEVRDTLCGHVSKSTGRLYGARGVALRRLAAAVGLLQVPPGVEMPASQ